MLIYSCIPFHYVSVGETLFQVWFSTGLGQSLLLLNILTVIQPSSRVNYIAMNKTDKNIYHCRVSFSGTR